MGSQRVRHDLPTKQQQQNESCSCKTLNMSKTALNFFSQEKVRHNQIIIQNIFNREYPSLIVLFYHKFIFTFIIIQGRRKTKIK